MHRELSDNEKIDWLQLIRSENVGPITFRRLLENYVTPANALKALPDLAKRGGAKKPITIANRASCEKEFTAAIKAGVRVLCMPEGDYPRLLRHIDDAPPVLMVRGHAHLLQKPMMAIVGTRNASLNGRKFADKLAVDLGAAGFVVVSGMARGVDGAAHAGALNAGTVAVLGSGVDVIYPQENAKLYEDIAQRGVIISEMPLGTPPAISGFPRRNRIISGLSLGTVVIEAALQSGSLITARMALEQGREVFAVPGSPIDPRCAGSNNLIREGATLVESVADIVKVVRPQLPTLAEEEHVSGFASPPVTTDEGELARAREEILELLSPTPTVVDELIRTSGYTTGVVLTVLLELEVAGRLVRQSGQKVMLVDQYEQERRRYR